jgi:hypothetical protein
VAFLVEGSGQPAATHASMSAARHRTTPPRRIGAGNLPALLNRHNVRTDTQSRWAKSWAETRREDVVAGAGGGLSINNLVMADISV